MPKRFAGRDILVNFGNVDDEILVCVNGRFAGPLDRSTLRRLAALTWLKHDGNADFDVTDAVEPGKTDSTVSRLDNRFDLNGFADQEGVGNVTSAKPALHQSPSAGWNTPGPGVATKTECFPGGLCHM